MDKKTRYYPKSKMRKPSEKQKAILRFLLDGDKKKSEIVEQFGRWYYANASHHVGQLLHRMIDRNLIVRVRRGVYGRRTSPVQVKGQYALFFEEIDGTAEVLRLEKHVNAIVTGGNQMIASEHKMVEKLSSLISDDLECSISYNGENGVEVRMKHEGNWIDLELEDIKAVLKTGRKFNSQDL